MYTCNRNPNFGKTICSDLRTRSKVRYGYLNPISKYKKSFTTFCPYLVIIYYDLLKRPKNNRPLR